MIFSNNFFYNLFKSLFDNKMFVIRPDSYPQSESPSADHQFGSYKDETSVGANDGTGLFKDQVMDLFQPWANLFTLHSITPSNVKEKASVSQVIEALDAHITLFAGNVDTMTANGTYTVDKENKNGVLLLGSPLTTVTLAAGAGIDDGSRFMIQNNTGGTVTINPGGILLADRERLLLFYNSDITAFDSVLGDNLVIGTFKITDSTDSTSKDTGAVILQNGGLGVEKAIHAGATVKADSTADATTKDTGAIIATAGGIGAEKSIVAGLGITAADAITAKIILGSDGKISTGGETAPDIDAGGICLNHGTNDGYVLTAKNSDVSHGVTTLAEDDTYLQTGKESDTAGGVSMSGYTSVAKAFVIKGVATTPSTTLGTGGTGIIQLMAAKKSGTTDGSAAADENLLAVRNGITSPSTVFIIKGDGDYFTDSASAGGAGTGDYTPRYYDKENDILLSNAMRKVIGGKIKEIDKNKELNKYKKRLEKLGILKNGFISGKGMWALNLGTDAQLFNMIKGIAKFLGIDEIKLLEFAKNYS